MYGFKESQDHLKYFTDVVISRGVWENNGDLAGAPYEPQYIWFASLQPE